MFGKKFFKNLIIVSAIVVFAVLIMTVIDKSTAKIADAYYALSNKPNQSYRQFNIPAGRINQNPDGTYVVDFQVSMNVDDADIEVTEEEFEGADGEDDTQTPGPDEEPPVNNPTPKPGEGATPTETPEPSEEPTETPSPLPTPDPTEEPIETPTEEPTEEPTETPSETPSTTPEPTENPTETPEPVETPEPTETPTPTPDPTETPEPSVKPTPVEQPLPGTNDIWKQIEQDIANGLYTREDIRSMVNVMGHEAYSTSYPGCLAVGFVIRNRANDPAFPNSIPGVCNDGMGQKNVFDNGDSCPENYLRAAQYVLSGGASTVGNAKFWFCPTAGYDTWAEPDCSGFANCGGNIFYDTWGEVHTSKKLPSDGNYILIFRDSTKEWIYGDGTRYP